MNRSSGSRPGSPDRDDASEGKRERNLELNLGKVCNNRCVFCLDARAPRESRRWVPVSRARKEIERARAEGATSIGLLGGEPTAHPRIIDLVETAREAGFTRIALATNALKLSDAGFARAVVNAGVTRVGISIHSHVEQIEDRLTGREGNFSRKMRAIRNLVGLQAEGLLPHNISLNAVLTTASFRSMPEYAAFFRGLGITDVRFNMLRTDSCPSLGPELTPRLGALSGEILRAVALNEGRLGMRMTFGDLPLCVFPWEVISRRDLAARTVGESVDLDTWVAVFHSPDDPGVDAQRFSWRDKKVAALKVKPVEVCDACRLSPACEGVWRSYHLLFGASELGVRGPR